MHNNEPTATFLQVLRDMSRTIEQMAPQQALTAIERDLLLAEMQQLYARVLAWPVAAPNALIVETAPEPQAAAPAAIEHTPAAAATERAAHVATVTEEVMEQLAEVVEEAVEQAMESGEEVALDIELHVAEQEDAPAEEPVATIEAQMPAEDPVPTVVAEAEEVQVIAAAPTPPQEAAAKRSVAFSLSGILQNQGDSQLVMAHLKLKPIDDLKSGIGLNEKFLFIRELFNNDHLAYAEAIEQLNACTHIETAEQIIANKLLPEYGWDLETEATVSFLHLVFRRFASKD